MQVLTQTSPLVPDALPVSMHMQRNLHPHIRSRRVGGGLHTDRMKIVNATPDPDGYATSVTLDSPTVSVSRGPVDQVIGLLGRLRYLPLGMPLRIATTDGPPSEVQGLEIRQIAHRGETEWAVVLVPQGVEPRRVLRDVAED